MNTQTPALFSILVKQLFVRGLQAWLALQPHQSQAVSLSMLLGEDKIVFMERIQTFVHHTEGEATVIEGKEEEEKEKEILEEDVYNLIASIQAMA